VKKNKFLLICLFLNIQLGFTQQGEDLFFSFDQVQSNIYSFAPTLKDTNNILNASMGNRSYSGVYSGISSRFLNFNFLSKVSSKQFHEFGFQVYQQNLGQYIRLNSGHIQYAFRIKLSRKADLTSGLSFGIKSLIIESSDAGGGGNSIVPDASLGLGIITPKIELSFGYKSFIKTEFLIDQYKIATTPVYNLNFIWKNRLQLRWDVNTQCLISVDNLGNKYYQVLPIFEWNRITQFGLGFRSNKGVFAQLGLIHINWLNLDSDLSATYLVVPLTKIQTLPNNVLEVVISVKKRK